MTEAVCTRTRSSNFWLLLKVVKRNGKIQTNQGKSKTGSQETEILVLVEVLACCVTLGRSQHLSESAILHLHFEGAAADRLWVSSLLVEPPLGVEDRLSLSLYYFPLSQRTPEILTSLQGSRHAFLGGFEGNWTLGPWSLVQHWPVLVPFFVTWRFFLLNLGLAFLTCEVWTPQGIILDCSF